MYQSPKINPQKTGSSRFHLQATCENATHRRCHDDEDELPPPPDMNPHKPSASATSCEPPLDPMLLELDPGEQVTEGMLMPPPPSPAEKPPTSQQLMTIDRGTILVASPNLVRQYHKHFTYQEYKNPNEKIVDMGLSDQREPVDLSTSDVIMDYTDDTAN